MLFLRAHLSISEVLRPYITLKLMPCISKTNSIEKLQVLKFIE